MIIQSGKKKSGGDGFTLIELAIVLVIVGLLITGVIQGREIIKQASIVAQVEQISDLKRGTLAFKLKYRCLPGDCRSATTFWPSESLTNGNQNGWIETTGGLTYDTPGITWAASNEINNFFKQL